MKAKHSDSLVKNIHGRLAQLGKKPVWISQNSEVTNSTVSRILNKESSPSLDSVYEVAKALECSVIDLLKEETAAIPSTLLGKLGKLSDGDLRVIEQFADQILLRVEAEKKSKI